MFACFPDVYDVPIGWWRYSEMHPIKKKAHREHEKETMHSQEGSANIQVQLQYILNFLHEETNVLRYKAVQSAKKKKKSLYSLCSARVLVSLF